VVGGRGVLGVRGQKFRGIVGHVYRVSCRVRDRFQQKNAWRRRRWLWTQQRDAYFFSTFA